MLWLLLYLAAINVLAFVLMAVDKRRAKEHGRRISERALFVPVILGGGLGGCLAMGICRHKTQHTAFNWGFPVLLVVQLFAVLAIWLLRLLPE